MSVIYGFWSDYSINDYLLMESPRIQLLFSPGLWMSHLVFSICWNNIKMASNASGRMNVQERDKEEEDKQHLAIYVACQEKAWPRFKVALATSKYLNLR